MGKKRALRQREMHEHDHAKSSTEPPSYDAVTNMQCGGSGNPPDAASHDRSSGRINIELEDGMDELLQGLNIEAVLEETESPATDRGQPPSATPPKMNILMLMVGSRGDVQPFICLAMELMQYGHRVRLATHTMFQAFVEEHGIEFFDLGGDPKELMAYMVKNPGLIPGFAALRTGEVQARRDTMRGIVETCWHACFQAGSKSAKQRPRKGIFAKTGSMSREQDPMPFVADGIIANPPSLGHVHCAERLGIPLHMFFTMPWSSTSQVPHPFANIKSSGKERPQTNFLSYLLVDGVIWQGLGSIINQFRFKTLELEPIHPSKAPVLMQHMRIPHSYCWSPTLLPRPFDWRGNIAVTGYAFLDGPTSYRPPADLQNFLSSGAAPIYIGFGSIVVDDPQTLTAVLLEAVYSAGIRAIIATGWNDNNESLSTDVVDPSQVYILRADCPHDWLFPQVRCVVHHGGAGTTAAGLRAGRPTIVVPFFGDQFFWGDIVHRAGAGPQAIPFRELSVEALAQAIRIALRPDTQSNAERIADGIQHEKGARIALEHFHSCLPQNMRCALLPDRAASWKFKTDTTQLSALAATILRKSNMIKWDDLQSYTPVKHGIGHSAYEPLSAGAWAVTELILDSFRGMGEMVAELGSFSIAVPRLIAKSMSGNKEVDTVAEAEDAAKSKATLKPGETGRRHKLPGEYMFIGTTRVLKAFARAPGEFAAGMAHGAHNMPLLWGDPTVRPTRKVTGVRSGMASGGLEMFWGLYDGCTGLFTQPAKGLIDEGAVGFAKGAGRGVLGMPVKFFAAANGIVGYPLKGFDVALSRAFRSDGMKAVEHQRILQGGYEYIATSEEVKQMVRRRWGERSIR